MDPAQDVRDALERAGCEPRGPLHNYRARCPAHSGGEGNPTALHVALGADERVVLFCFRGCSTEEVVHAVGLSAIDLFPLGHRNGRRHPVLARDTRRIADLVLGACRELGIDYRGTRNPGVWVAEECPACRLGAFIVHEDDEDRRPGRVLLSCVNGCAPPAVLDALMGVER